MINEQILEENKITEEQKQEITKNIEKIILAGRTPVEHPICVIVGGQSGAGKSGLMAYSTKMFPDGNFIMLEDDFLRHFYPNEREISIKYPNEYIAITNGLTNGLTNHLFNLISDGHYNLIFHQTLKNNRIADDGIVMLKNKGYSVVVRGLAVSCLESRMSMMERCIGLLQKDGYCRPVTTADHDITYNGMPNTIEYIEQKIEQKVENAPDLLEIFKRGESPNSPVRVYAKVNQNSGKHIENIATHPEVLTKDFTNGFSSARDAVLKSREKEAEKFLITGFEERIQEVLDSVYITPTILDQAKELEELIRSKSYLQNSGDN